MTAQQLIRPGCPNVAGNARDQRRKRMLLDQVVMARLGCSS
jgi:hypothetical protein